MGLRASRAVRHVLVALHVVASVGWMGAGASNVVLASIAMQTGDASLRATCYYLVERLDAYLVIPLAFGALVSGIVVAALTPWGLTQYWWVLVKLVLTVVVIGFSTFAIGVWVEESIQRTETSDAESPVALALTIGASANLLAFAFMTWVSSAKPWGRTPWNSSIRAQGERRSRAPTP